MAPPRKKTEEKAEGKDAVVFDLDAHRPQFFNTNDWPLVRRVELFRAKEIDGKMVLVDEKGGVQVLEPNDFSTQFESVKGPHKREF